MVSVIEEVIFLRKGRSIFITQSFTFNVAMVMSEKYTQGSILDPFHHGMLIRYGRPNMAYHVTISERKTFIPLMQWHVLGWTTDWTQARVLSMIWCCGCTDEAHGRRFEKCSEVKSNIVGDWLIWSKVKKKESRTVSGFSYSESWRWGCWQINYWKVACDGWEEEILDLLFKKTFNVYLILSKSFKRSQIFLSKKRKKK